MIGSAPGGVWHIGACVLLVPPHAANTILATKAIANGVWFIASPYRRACISGAARCSVIATGDRNDKKGTCWQALLRFRASVTPSERDLPVTRNYYAKMAPSRPSGVRGK